MGTRSAIGFILNGKVFASYNQYDGYPTGVGRDLQKELKGQNLEKLKVFAEKAVHVAATAKPTKAHIRAAKAVGLSFQEVSTGIDYYSLLRDHHGTIVPRLHLGIMTDDAEFLRDSLFCEFAYLINFDSMEIEILRGFNKNKRKQHKFCKVDIENWKPAYEGDVLKYYGCANWWKGTLADFIALDMEKLENSLD